MPPAGQFARHGGRIAEARTLFPEAPQPWVDLSTGINRRRYPAPRATTLARQRLPDAIQLAALEAIAANAFGVDDPDRVVAVAGTESAIRLLPRVLTQRKAVILGPTYSSHADAWSLAGAHTVSVEAAQLPERVHDSHALTIVNPNNPDGRVISLGHMLALHDRMTDDGVLVVDEAFVDTDPSISVSPIAGTSRAPRLIVFRSFGKFYGLAGIRLGFIIAAPQIVQAIRSFVGDWPVSADALAAGCAAYADDAWACRTRDWLQRSASRLDALLIRQGFEIVGGTSLYRLARASDAAQRFQRMVRRGILTRPFDHDATLLRFGLPYGRSEWNRFAAAGAGR